MRGINTSVTKLRRKIFVEVAKVAYLVDDENVNSAIEAIPYTISPTEVPQYRESIYRERAIATASAPSLPSACVSPSGCRSARRTGPSTSRRGWMRAISPTNTTSLRSCRSFLRRATSARTTSMK